MEPALALVRFAHFAATMYVFGAGVFLWAFTPPTLRSELSPPLRRVAVAASVVALLAALGWFALEGASMADDWTAAYDPSVLGDVLTSTTFGLIWTARIPLLVALVLALLLTRAEDWRLSTLAAGLALAGLSLVDHGAMQSGVTGLIHRANDALHLLTAGFWLGSLAPFALCVAASRRSNSSHDADEAMLRFSTVGHVTVFALIATGAANIALTTGQIPWPPTSLYRALLATKLTVVATMIAMAWINRYVLLPQIEASRGAATALRVTCLVELALAGLVLGLVSYFGLLDPA